MISRIKDWLSSFFSRKDNRTRLTMTIFGVVVSAISVGFFRQAAFGTDPFQCMCAGLDNVIPISFGTLYVIINLVLLCLMLLTSRKFIGIATFINMFLTGYIVEFSEGVIYGLFGDPPMVTRIIYLIIGIVVMCLASAFYFTADLGVSTYDFIALRLSEIQKKVPFRLIRICTDLICVGIGFALGFVPGVGTIITAFFMGPLISFFIVRAAKPFLQKGSGIKTD